MGAWGRPEGATVGFVVRFGIALAGRALRIHAPFSELILRSGLILSDLRCCMHMTIAVQAVHQSALFNCASLRHGSTHHVLHHCAIIELIVHLHGILHTLAQPPCQ